MQRMVGVARIGHQVGRNSGMIQALVGILLIGGVAFGGCSAQSIGARTAQASPTVTPTPLPARSLSWQPGTSPVHLTREVSPPELKPSPADGRVAYLCASPPTETPGVEPQVWVTHDRGAHWTTISTIPLARHYNGCHMLANDTNAASAIVEMTYDGADPNANVVADFATFDYGRSWTRMGPSDGGHAVQVASTHDGKSIYILRSRLDGNVVEMQLSRVPVGGLNDTRAWQPIDVRLGDRIDQFSLNPTTGALLVWGNSALPGSDPLGLYQTSDGGTTWSRIPAPELYRFSVQPASVDQPWHICGEVRGAVPTDTLTCTFDGGKTWSTRQPPPFDACSSCASSASLMQQVAASPRSPTSGLANYLVGLASDGSFLEIVNHLDVDTNGPPRYTLYRLAQGATQWQSLGTIPELAVSYASSPNAGVLWALPAVGIPIDAQQRPFTADYPS